MRQTIINVIKYRLTLGRTKEEIVTGLAFTICETLDITKQELLSMIIKAKAPVDHIGTYAPPKTFNLFSTEFNKGEFEKIKSIKDINQLTEIEPLQSNG